MSLVTAALGLTAFGIHHTSAQSCDDLEEELRLCRLQELSPTPSPGLDEGKRQSPLYQCWGHRSSSLCGMQECHMVAEYCARSVADTEELEKVARSVPLISKTSISACIGGYRFVWSTTISRWSMLVCFRSFMASVNHGIDV